MSNQISPIEDTRVWQLVLAEGKTEDKAEALINTLTESHPMSQLAIQPFLSVADYLAGEDGAELRHEYIAGQVYAMTGASRRHGLIVLNIATALRPRIRGSGCQLFANDMKVRLRIGSDDIFYYPDLLLTCDPGDREAYYCTRPCLIVEVLSASTERVDRREKLLAYATLPSLQEYLLVSQERREVQVHRRATDWDAERLTEGSVRLDCLAAELALETIYDEVDVQSPSTP